MTRDSLVGLFIACFFVLIGILVGGYVGIAFVSIGIALWGLDR
jgi:hypothetical protein